MSDPTEMIRRVQAQTINANPGSREYLESKHGRVYDTSELQSEFTVIGFLAPYVIVQRADGVKGSLLFQHSPRLYHSFSPE